MSSPMFLRRKEAADYLKSKFGWGSWQTLAKLAVTGDGPVFRKLGKAALYAPSDLDEWALMKIGIPYRSTSDASYKKTSQSLT